MKLSALVSNSEKIQVVSVKRHSQSESTYVVTTLKGGNEKKFLCGAKSLDSLQVDNDKFLIEGTFKTFNSGGSDWLTTAESRSFLSVE